MCRYIALVLIPIVAWACCPPTKWEGTQYVALGSTDKDGTSHYAEIQQNVTVDSDMRRSFISQSLMWDGMPVRQNILQDFGSGEQYVTTIKEDGSMTCERMDIESIEPGCIPMNATKIIQSYFGSGSSKINATMYKISMDQSVIYATMSDNGCIPLAYEASGVDRHGAGYQMTVEFFHITPGIADTSVFETPRICARRMPGFAGIGK